MDFKAKGKMKTQNYCMYLIYWQ